MENERIRAAMTKKGRDGDCEIAITGLTPREFEMFEGFLHGTQRIELNREGRLKSLPVYAEAPGPMRDPLLVDFWPLNPPPYQLKIWKYDEIHDYSFPSLIMQHVGAMGDDYRNQASTAISFGFQPLRSPRGLDGRYWEIWYLPFFEAAKGELAEHIKTLKGKPVSEQVTSVVQFLCRNVRFGTLNVDVQRAALVIED